MALDTSEASVQGSSGFYPGEVPLNAPRPSSLSGWLRPHILWAMLGAVLGWLFGHWLGNVISGSNPVFVNSGTNNVATVLGLSFGVLGWLIGIGALTYPLLKIIGREP